MKKEARVNPIERALELRKTLKVDDKILVVDFSDTLQGQDTSKIIDLMPIVGTNNYVFRTKVNVKEIDPIAVKQSGKPYFDVSKKSDEEIENFVKRQEFDFPLWFKNTPGFEMRHICDYNPPFILQVAGCNFHDGSATGGCQYCFVDDKSNDGKPAKGKVLLGIEDTVNSMLAAREQVNRIYASHGQNLDLKVLRISGGEPTVVLDWVLDVWREIAKRKIHPGIVGQLDSNLSTGALVDDFEKQGIYEKHILEKLAEYPIKVLTALKGSDEKNMQDNVQSTATMAAQLYSLKRFIKAGFDIYPQLYNPNPNSLEEYVSKLDSEIGNISLRIHLGPLKIYGPTKLRLTLEAQKLGVNPEIYITQKAKEWENNYVRCCAIMDDYLNKRFGAGYKELVRSDVKIGVRKE